MSHRWRDAGDSAELTEGKRMSRRGYVFKKCTACGRKVDDKVCTCKARRFTWAYRVDVAPKGAQRRQVTRSGFDTRAAALAALGELQGDLRSGTQVDPSKLTLGKYLSRWIEAVDVRPSTRAGYEGHIRNHIIPGLGEWRVQDLDSTAIKTFYASLTTLAPRTVHRIHNTLHRALEDAIQDQVIAHNPADKAHTEPEADHDMTTWTAEELARFLWSVREDRLFPMWRVFAMTGMRRGEVAGLRWDSVDLGAKTVTVQRTRVRVRGGVAEGPPKTNRGRRTIDLDERTVDALVSWAALQVEERVGWGGAYQDGGWVFTWEDGRPLEPTGISSRFARRLKDADVPKLRLHDLRDTHATLLLKEGVAPHVVSQRLGHSSVAFTLQVYAHVLPGQQSEAAEKVAALVDGSD